MNLNRGMEMGNKTGTWREIKNKRAHRERRQWHREGDRGGDFPRGWETLNGKFNRAMRCNHKSQEGGKPA